jgi:nucleoside-diphosphate-sugar epimerase
MFNNKEHIKLYEKVLDNENFFHLHNKVIFITGATGFLGMWVLRAINYLNKKLKLNIKVIILLRSKNKKATLLSFDNTKIDYIYGTVTNFSYKKKKIDHIIHLAAETSKKKNKDNIEVINTIINGTIRVIEYSKFVKSSSISYLSSGGVYGKNCNNVNGWIESDNYSPNIYDNVATYGLSKKCAENILVDSFNKVELKTLNIFRAFSFGGSYFNYDNHFAFDNFIKKRIKKEDISLISDGAGIRNYIHPLDLVCWILLSKKFHKINLINTGSNKNYSIKSLANRVAQIKFYDLPAIRVNTGNKKINENYIPNLSLAKKLGFKAKISLDMQIKDSLNYYYGKKI